MTEPLRPGHEGMIPYLIVQGADAAIEFYGQAFGATETMRLPMPDGSVAHAELTIDGQPIYLADDNPGMEGGPMRSPTNLGATSVTIHRYVADCDAAFRLAVEAGATALREPEDQFYGDRAATVQDPYGHVWSVHTRIESVSMAEMMEAMSGG